MYKFIKSSSNIKPKIIDLTSSSYGIYYRKNIEEKVDELGNAFYKYDEIYLPNNFRFKIDDIEVYSAKIEEILAKLNSDFENLKEQKYLENDSKADLARYNQEFTITIQDKECTFDTSSKTQKDLLTAFAVCFSTGRTYDGWVTNNGVELDLTLEDVATIATTFKELSNVYPKWKEFKEQIDKAVTIAELESIVIDYEMGE